MSMIFIYNAVTFLWLFDPEFEDNSLVRNVGDYHSRYCDTPRGFNIYLHLYENLKYSAIK